MARLRRVHVHRTTIRLSVIPANYIIPIFDYPHSRTLLDHRRVCLSRIAGTRCRREPTFTATIAPARS